MRMPDAAGLSGWAARQCRGGLFHGLRLRNLYRVSCTRPSGRSAWMQDFTNLVTDAGLDDLLQQYFKGSDYDAGWHVGLVAGAAPAFDPGDTLSLHPGWSEFDDYAGDRPILTLGVVTGAAVDNAASRAQFAIDASGTIGGVFVCSAATGSGGVLFAEGALDEAREVLAGDTVSVEITLTAGSA